MMLRRNKREFIIRKQLDAAKQEEQRLDALEALMTPKVEESKASDPVWSAKTQEIRNRLTDKKRMAGDRWNRFAGTEGGGGRGL